MATVTIGDANLDDTIANNEMVLLDFWAEWCGPCRMFGPIFEEASEKHGNIVFGKVDTEAERELAAAAGIASIPTLMAFKKGHLVFSQAGALPASSLDELVTALVELDVEAAIAEQEANEKQGKQD